MSAKGERLEPAQVFPGQEYSLGVTHCPMHVHVLLNSQGKCWSFSMFPMTVSSSKFSFLFFLASFLLAPSVVTTSGSSIVQQLLLMIFTNASKERLFAPSEV